MPTSISGEWLRQLRERGVLRVAASYAVIAWLLLQIADVTFEPLGVPRWAMVSLIVAAVLGLPVATALAWFYEAGERGFERDTTGAGVARPITRGLRRYADIVIIAVLLTVVAVLLVRQTDLGRTGAGNPAIAVLPFQNLSSVPEGNILALGIAESVLYQLSNLAQLDVISRTSSFAFTDRRKDAQQIGRELGAGYLLEGSVQSDGSRMRVTTQLVDAISGSEIWAMRFDRPTGDIFSIQDEIALQVTQALELSLDPSAVERITGLGTDSLAAYLAYAQGRALLANNRLSNTAEAVGHFERALKLDPDFAAAYVSLAEAELFVAEYEIRPDRQSRFESALQRGQELVAKALALDPDSGDAYLQRAHLSAFVDLSAAEVDYRRGLALKPNSAKGYAGLAAVVYENPPRRNEALEMLDRARRLDPLEPAYDTTKALFLQMEHADFAEANTLLVDVVTRHPRYQPALFRLAELRYLVGQPAQSILYGERALALDPGLELVRRNLISAYVDLGDFAAARQLDDDENFELSPRQLKLLMRGRDWRQAGGVAYDTVAKGRLLSDIETAMNVAAIRMHARASGDFDRARAALEEWSGVHLGGDGRPDLPQEGSPLRDAAIGLADVLLASGQEQQGHRLLATILSRMRYEVEELGRPEYWYYRWHPTALALSGEHDAAIAMIERSIVSGIGLGDWWYYLEMEPAYAPLRQDPRFQATLRKVRDVIHTQRLELDRMRRDGLVPDRSQAIRPRE